MAKTIKVPTTPLEILQEASFQAWRKYRVGWTPGGKNAEYDTWQAEAAKVSAYVARLWAAFNKQLGLEQTQTAYAYSPRERTASQGGYHIIVPQDGMKFGKAVRNKGDAICKPAKKFWGLTILGGSELPNCKHCLAAMEKAVGPLPLEPEQ
jgi:hypothetical protein